MLTIIIVRQYWTLDVLGVMPATLIILILRGAPSICFDEIEIGMKVEMKTKIETETETQTKTETKTKT